MHESFKPSLLSRSYLENLRLRMSWPSPQVRTLFTALLTEYVRIVGQRPRTSDCNLVAPFSRLCESLVEVYTSSRSLRRFAGRSIAADSILQIPSDQLPQAISSALAMVLHCNPQSAGSGERTNDRRPRHRYSTYPNSPGLSRLVCDSVFERLLSIRIPKRCKSSKEADEYAERALRFTVLDPSMEGGQLLLGLAEAWVRRVHQRHAEGSSDGSRLIRAGLDKLCKDCLYGADRNPLALVAVRTAFRVYSNSLGLKPTVPRHLSCCDSLRTKAIRKVDAIIKNPPWGERLSA